MFHMTPETRAELEALRAAKGTITTKIEATVRKARNEGASHREIANYAGISHTEVRRILNKETTQ